MIEKDRFVQFLISEGAVRFGDFTLKSGVHSPFFVDLGRICTGGSLAYLGECLADTVVNHYGAVDVLYGPPYKAIPMITASALALRQRTGKDVGICYARKEKKGHGEGGMLIGQIPSPGSRVLVLDDVFTTGATKLDALEHIEAASGARALGIVVAVDRRKRGVDSGLGTIPLTSLVELADVVAHLEAIGDSHAHAVRRFWEE